MQQMGLFSDLPLPANSGSRQLRTVGPRNTHYQGWAVEALVAEIAKLNGEITALHKSVSELRSLLLSGTSSKDSYTTKEVAQILGRKPYTVREWARLQRINATKAMCGRGCEEEWRVSHDELVRIQNDGLLPVPERY